MASPVPPTPNTGNAPATPKHRNRLALTSLLLSFAPLGAFVLAIVVGGVLEQLVFPNALTSDPATVGLVFVWVTVVLSIATLLAGIGAIVTGGLALRRAKQYPPQQAQAWRGLAMAGLVIGIVWIILLLCGGALLGVVNSFCSRSC